MRTIEELKEALSYFNIVRTAEVYAKLGTTVTEEYTEYIDTAIECINNCIEHYTPVEKFVKETKRWLGNEND